MRSRGYVFTLNNYTDKDEERIQGIDSVYLVYGREKAPTTGTPHLQGYIRFKSAKTLSAAIKQLERCHVEIAKGDIDQCVDYCKKEGDYIEIGCKPMSQKEKGKAEKERYKRAYQSAKEGKLEEIDADIMVRHYSTLKKIKRDHQITPESIPELVNEWYYGESGTGKSRKAREENPEAYIKNCNKWWCGYDGQDVVIIEEWSPQHECLVHHLKTWADHYAFQGETKGSSTLIRPKKIIVTSNYHPEECFSNVNDLGPILRRFKVTHFNKI